MRVRLTSRVALVSLLLAGASSGANAIPFEMIDLNSTTAGTFAAPSPFSTTGSLGGVYLFSIDQGQAVLDTGSSVSATTQCTAASGAQCADNGTRALYMFSSPPPATVTLSADTGMMLSIDSFYAAIAAISPGLLLPLGCDPTLPLDDPSAVQCVIDFGSSSNPADFIVSGKRNATVGGPEPIPQEIFLDPTVGGESFGPQLLADFINLDWVKFTDNSASALCTPCSGNFALDDFHVSSDAIPTGPPPPPPGGTAVPEPASFGVLGAGLFLLGWARRRAKRGMQSA